MAHSLDVEPYSGTAHRAFSSCRRVTAVQSGRVVILKRLGKPLAATRRYRQPQCPNHSKCSNHGLDARLHELWYKVWH